MDEYFEEEEESVPEARKYNCYRYQECYTEAAKLDLDMKCDMCILYAGQKINHPIIYPEFDDIDQQSINI